MSRINCREHDNSANRAQKSRLKGLENRDKESLAEEIAALRKELLETREAATRVKQEKQRRERDLHLLSKQVCCNGFSACVPYLAQMSLTSRTNLKDTGC
jgi:hypothetical protein